MIKGRIATTVASVALALGGALTVAPSAVAQSGSSSTAVPSPDKSLQRACWGTPERGSGGHYGNSGWCDTGRYRQVIRCETLGGYRYIHYGPWEWAPTKSTAWCNLGDRVVETWLE
ncbi:hypothetical protein [Streptomyces sp. NPDC087300]|uniref:hypothetical protein n=1 Tax=Streptomyces sp. NPDC087300 TaxID=3365780 RepID=UPI00381B5718